MATKKKSEKMCGCVTKMAKVLAKENTVLDHIFTLPNGRVYPQIATAPLNPKGPKPKKLIPTYCPFCGKKYP